MGFCEKLDFIMNLTKTTNSALSLHTSLDASHISRLRRGQRNMPGDKAVIKSMSAYFVRHCTEDYQRKALSDALKCVWPLPEDKELAESIFLWLSEEQKAGLKSVEKFLHGFSSGPAKKPVPGEHPENAAAAFPKNEVSVFYGLTGKREAAMIFLSEVVSNDEPQTLLLFSDEATDWMTGSPEFAARWASYMTRVLSRGNRIKVVHTINRDLDEMLRAIGQWMPLYMTGSIESYFCPKKRDGIFKQTLFIAPATGAVVTSSVGDLPDQAVLLLRNKRAVGAYADEFMQFLRLCKPLMRIFTARERNTFLDILLGSELEEADAIIQTGSLSLLTMPETVVRSIFSRQDKGGDGSIFDYYHQRSEIFQRVLQSNSITEIVRLPDAADVLDGNVSVALPGMLYSHPVYYTAEEYILHLEHVVWLLETCRNFHVCLLSGTDKFDYIINAKEDTGAFITSISGPPVVLFMNEPNMTIAFWDFLKSETMRSAYKSTDNRSAAEKLHGFIGEIKKALVIQPGENF
jgi:hypothetical protein